MEIQETSRIARYGPLFGVDTNLDSEAPDAGTHAPPSLIIKTSTLPNKEAKQAPTSFTVEAPQTVTLQEQCPVTDVTQTPLKQSLLYSLVMCSVWSVVLVVFSFFAAVIHFDIMLLSKRSGFVAWVTRLLVLTSLLSATCYVSYLAAPHETQWYQTATALDHLNSELTSLHFRYSDLEGKLHKLDTEDVLQAATKLIEEHALKDSQMLQEFVTSLIMSKKPYITQEDVWSIVSSSTKGLTTGDVIHLIKTHGGVPLTQSEVVQLVDEAAKRIEVTPEKMREVVMDYISTARAQGLLKSEISEDDVLEIIQRNAEIQTLLSPDYIRQTITEKITEELAENFMNLTNVKLEEQAEAVRKEVGLSKSDIQAKVEELASNLLKNSGGSLTREEITRVADEMVQEKLQFLVGGFDALQSKQNQLEDIMGKTANTIQSADRKIDQLHKAGNTIRDHLSALRQDLASADQISSLDQARDIAIDMVKQEMENRNFQLTTREDIEEILRQLLDTYSADRLGFADYALASIGGVVREASSEIPINAETEVLFSNNKTLIENRLPMQYKKYFPDLGEGKSPLWSFGFIYKKLNLQPRTIVLQPPSVMLTPSLVPGDCWCFPGYRARIKIELPYQVPVTHVSIDHAHVKILPDGGTSAPKQIRVHGVTPSGDEILLKDFNYDPHDAQIFTQDVSNVEHEAYKRLVFEIVSNYGSYYTCIYRLRVHSNLGQTLTE